MRRSMITLVLVGSLAWLVAAALLVHPEHFLQGPARTWEYLRWQLSDCEHLHFAADASAGDRMVARVRCYRAQHSGIRRHIAIMVLPPVAAVFLLFFVGWVARIVRAER